MRLAIWTMAAMAIALPAAAQVRVAISEEVSFTVADGASTVEKRLPAVPNPYEHAVAQEFSRGEHKDAIGATGKVVSPRADQPAGPIPEAGKIRVRFTPVSRGADALLVIENGYDRALVYRATIGAGDKSAPTDVCLVMPGKVSVEHWPFKIDWIALRDFRLVPWKPGDPLTCA